MDLPLVLGTGAGRLVLDLGGEHAEVTLSGYEGGLGTASVSIPPSAVSGQVPVPVVVTETGGTGGRFRLELEATDASGAVVAAAAGSWTLEAGASAEETVWLTLPEGDYTATASLNGQGLGQWPRPSLRDPGGGRRRGCRNGHDPDPGGRRGGADRGGGTGRPCRCAQLPEGTELELRTLEGSLVFPESGSQTFQVPEGTPYGRYPLLWTLTGSPDADSGTYDIQVRGPRVRILHLEVPREPVQPGERVAALVTVASDSDVDVSLHGWVAAADGPATPVSEVPLLLVAGDLRRVELPFTVGDSLAGAHRLVVEAASPSGRPLATAQAVFEVGGADLLGVSTERSAYHPGEPVTARVTVGGTGPAQLAVFLDSVSVHTEQLALSGTQILEVDLGAASPGRHTVAAELVQGATSTRRTCGFEVVTAPLRIEAEGIMDGGVVGVPYERALTVSGGAPGYTWRQAGGELPPGIALDPGTGTLAGTPTEPGTWVGVAAVSDGTGQEAVAGVRITVAGEPLEVLTSELPTAFVGQPYAAALEAGGGTPPYLWRIVDGALPPGLHLEAGTGLIAGQPEASGAALLTIEVMDAGGLTAGRAFELAVAGRAPAVPALGGSGRAILVLLVTAAALLLLRRR